MAAKIYQAHKLKSLPTRHVALWRHLGGEVTPTLARSHDSLCVHEKESPADRICSVGLSVFFLGGRNFTQRPFRSVAVVAFPEADESLV